MSDTQDSGVNAGAVLAIIVAVGLTLIAVLVIVGAAVYFVLFNVRYEDRSGAVGPGQNEGLKLECASPVGVFVPSDVVRCGCRRENVLIPVTVKIRRED